MILKPIKNYNFLIKISAKIQFFYNLAILTGENMKHGICKLSTIPMRGGMSHNSELVSELLFNDIYEVIEEDLEWIRIRCLYDLYEGWIRKLQHYEISDSEYKSYLEKEKFIINVPVSLYNNKVISFGSEVFEKTNDSIPMGDQYNPNKMVESAARLLEIPYRWGGKSVMGIDCSAFVQLCAKVSGYKLPRDASQQVNYGECIPTLKEARAGDLAFFENDDRSITHVGILLSDDKIIHASGKVRIDSINKNGIYNKELVSVTHKLSIIKRL